MGGRQARQVRAAVAATRLVHDRGAGPLSQPAAAIVRTVIHDDDLAGDAVVIQHLPRSINAIANRAGLVETRDHDGKLHCADGYAQPKQSPSVILTRPLPTLHL